MTSLSILEAIKKSVSKIKEYVDNKFVINETFHIIDSETINIVSLKKGETISHAIYDIRYKDVYDAYKQNKKILLDIYLGGGFYNSLLPIGAREVEGGIFTNIKFVYPCSLTKGDCLEFLRVTITPTNKLNEAYKDMGISIFYHYDYIPNNFITNDSLPTKLSDLENDMNFVDADNINIEFNPDWEEITNKPFGTITYGFGSGMTLASEAVDYLSSAPHDEIISIEGTLSSPVSGGLAFEDYTIKGDWFNVPIISNGTQFDILQIALNHILFGQGYQKGYTRLLNNNNQDEFDGSFSITKKIDPIYLPDNIGNASNKLVVHLTEHFDDNGNPIGYDTDIDYYCFCDAINSGIDILYLDNTDVYTFIFNNGMLTGLFGAYQEYYSVFLNDETNNAAFVLEGYAALSNIISGDYSILPIGAYVLYLADDKHLDITFDEFMENLDARPYVLMGSQVPLYAYDGDAEHVILKGAFGDLVITITITQEEPSEENPGGFARIEIEQQELATKDDLNSPIVKEEVIESMAINSGVRVRFSEVPAIADVYNEYKGGTNPSDEICKKFSLYDKLNNRYIDGDFTIRSSGGYLAFWHSAILNGFNGIDGCHFWIAQIGQDEFWIEQINSVFTRDRYELHFKRDNYVNLLEKINALEEQVKNLDVLLSNKITKTYLPKVEYNLYEHKIGEKILNASLTPDDMNDIIIYVNGVGYKMSYRRTESGAFIGEDSTGTYRIQTSGGNAIVILDISSGNPQYLGVLARNSMDTFTLTTEFDIKLDYLESTDKTTLDRLLELVNV